MTTMEKKKATIQNLIPHDYVVPRLAPAPVWSGVTEEPVICLDGLWEVRDYEDNSVRSVQVPSDMGILRKEGFSQHYEYRREITVPKSEEGGRILLRFEGVNGFARVYVDDEYIASHENGFLTWNVEITKQVRDREKVLLKVVMDEESDQVSAYSHGGILHSVYLYVLPRAYVSAVYLSPLFDEDMDTCTLRVDMDLEQETFLNTEEEAEALAADGGAKRPAYEAEFLLEGPDGVTAVRQKVKLDNRMEGYYTFSLPVDSPRLWDAEHPAMYRLEINLYCGGERIETVRKKTGLRRLDRKGNRLFVNGREIKLRGACRHEIGPRSGRALTRELIEQDVALFKEANCNYIRTSHYPPSEYFLELCDEFGIYVEDELALAFIARSLPYTQRDPEQTRRYISHFTECLARDYNHPSVIIWSLCNESFGGYNFDLLNRFAHRMDPTRMTKFSYPMTIREEHEMPDIWSIHYSEYNTDLAKKRDNVSVGHAPGRDMPVLHDEYVHVSCYNREELRRDPAVRSFWGEGIRMFWDNIWNTEGALGGAIWAGIDETDIYDGGNTQLEWGIIDVWRRRKPEFYMTRKAYSPLKVLHSQLLVREKKVVLVVENRFCHTDLSEVRMEWKWGELAGSGYLPAAVPGKTVKALICLDESIQTQGAVGTSGQDRTEGDNRDSLPVQIAFYDARGSRVDEIVAADRDGCQESLLDAGCCGENADSAGESEGITIIRTERETLLSGKEFTMSFSRETGLLTGLWTGGKRLLTGGPVLNVPYMRLGEWYLNSFEAREEGTSALVVIQGGYRHTLEITWKIAVRPDGEFTTQYTIGRMEKSIPKQLKLRVGVDCGGLDELGAAYFADPSMDTLSWKRSVDPDREGAYSWYPQDHISRNAGTACRFSQGNVWGQQPAVSWSNDMKNDILNGYYDVEYKGTNDFRSTKENVREAYLYSGQDKAAIAVFGEAMGTDWGAGEALEERSPLASCANVRLEVADPQEWKIIDSDQRIRYTGTWYPVEDRKESDHGTEMWSREKGACAECTFTGTGVVWYGPQDTTYGMADVYIDGRPAARRLSQRVSGVDFSCSSVGYDKKYHLPVFSVTDLPYGEHTIRIEVCGEKASDASDCYIVIDYLRILNGERTEPVKLIVNQEFSFPHLSWGNYRKPPVLMEEGTVGVVRMKAVCLQEISIRDKIEEKMKNEAVF